MSLRKLGVIALLLALSACGREGRPLVFHEAPPAERGDESAFIQEEYQI